MVCHNQIFVVAFVSHNHTHPAHMHDQLVENSKIIQGSTGGREISLSAAQVELMPKVRANWSVLLYRRPALPTHARYPSTVHNAVA